MRRTTAVLAAVLLVVAGAAPAVGATSGPPAASGAPATTDAPTPAPTLDGSGAATRATQATNCTFPATVTDATGTEVTVESRPERVTALGASAAQTMWTIDAREQVVGVTQTAFYLDGAESKTNVSSTGFGPSVERVVGTNPGLVVAANIISERKVSRMREAGLTVYYAPLATNVSDVREKTTAIGRLTGNCAGAAEANAWMTANVAAAANATADLDRPSALYPLGGGFVANTGTFISAMIEAAGADNAIAEANVTGAYPEVSGEIITRLAPEVLVLSNGSQHLTAQEPYASTPAVRQNDTVTVDANYLNQPAPRSVVYAVRNLTTGFHPDVDPAFVNRDAVGDGDGNATPTPTPTPTPDPTPLPDDDDDDDDSTPTPTATPTATPTPSPTATATVTATMMAADETDGTTATPTDAPETAAADPTTAAATETAGTTETATPGFGVAAAALALLASAFLARRDP